jgi:hypothetical protein
MPFHYWFYYDVRIPNCGMICRTMSERLLYNVRLLFRNSTLSTVISLCNTIYERGLEGKHPMNSVSNTNQELTLFGGMK